MSKSMDGINIKKSEALEVLNIKMQCDVRCNRDLHPKENGIQLLCVGWCLNVYFETSRPRRGLDEITR